MRFVTRKVHSLLDYAVALSLFVMPFILGLGVTNPAAKWLSVATGAAAFVLTRYTSPSIAWSASRFSLHRSCLVSADSMPCITGPTRQRS